MIKDIGCMEFADNAGRDPGLVRCERISLLQVARILASFTKLGSNSQWYAEWHLMGGEMNRISFHATWWSGNFVWCSMTELTFSDELIHYMVKLLKRFRIRKKVKLMKLLPGSRGYL